MRGIETFIAGGLIAVGLFACAVDQRDVILPSDGAPELEESANPRSDGAAGSSASTDDAVARPPEGPAPAGEDDATEAPKAEEAGEVGLDPSSQEAAGNSAGSPPPMPSDGIDGAMPPSCPASGCVANAIFRLAFEGDGLGRVVASREGADDTLCQGTCTIEAPVGSVITFTASPEERSVLLGWSDPACSGSSCAQQVDVDGSLSVEFELAHNVAFVTSQLYQPGSMPRAGAEANAECARLAGAAGLHGTRWVAWLSAEGPTLGIADDVQPADFFQSTGGWVRTDGAIVSRSLSRLLAGEVLHPIVRDERGGPPPLSGVIWSNTGLGGFLARAPDGSSIDCNNWTSNDSTLFGRHIVSGGLGVVFYGRFSITCNVQAALYCFGDDSDDEIPPIVAPVPNRLAFLSTSLYTPTGGLAGADALCQRDACAAGLTGGTDCASSPGTQRTFKAYLHTLAQRAWERFDLDGPTWVRPDGVQWMPEARTLARDGVGKLTALNVTLALEYTTASRTVWVGDAAGMNTCEDWTSQTAQVASTIYDISSGSPLSSFETRECTGTARLYCLED